MRAAVNKLDYEHRGALRPGRALPAWARAAIIAAAAVAVAVPLIWLGVLFVIFWWFGPE